MTEVMYWVLLGLAALVAGVFNLPAAFEKLKDTIKGLVFFKPLQSPGFWVWILAQLLFPSAIFLLWVTDAFTVRPAIDVQLFARAIGAGFSFVAFLNARTETAFLTIDIKSLYDRLVVLGFRLIAAQETRRTARFLREFERELSRPEANLDEGLKDMRAYFSADISLLPETEQTYLDIIDKALMAMPVEGKIQVIQSLIPSVRANDLLYTLQQFNCSADFLHRYFPNQIKRVSPPIW